jgi:hypothetical protein
MRRVFTPNSSVLGKHQVALNAKTPDKNIVTPSQAWRRRWLAPFKFSTGIKKTAALGGAAVWLVGICVSIYFSRNALFFTIYFDR